MVKQLQKANKNPDSDPKGTSSRIQLKELNDFIITRTCSYSSDSTHHTYFQYNILTFSQLDRSSVFVPPKLNA
jgi:hypothetical protein